MSCLFCIGVESKNRVGPLEGFSNQAIDDYGREALAKAVELNAYAEWFLAVDNKFNSDTDISYEISGSIVSGKLGKAIDLILPDSEKLLVFMYDLGTDDEEHHAGLKLSEVKQTLGKWYAMGAPNKTVYHEFFGAI